ncbi:MAG: cupin domain-containing protein [Planctomycetes bacterium]|nr:cupin domain-containing protein [Planctomycetota bacterium]
MTDDLPPQIVNVDEAELRERRVGPSWGAAYQILTPSMQPRGGRLGVNRIRLAPHSSAVPFHSHRREDEVFFVLEGRGVFRYGDQPLREIRAGDCIACPAGTGIAHQLANPFDDELIYLAIGPFEPDEVCEYPDSGKVLVRGLGIVGRLTRTDYLDGEGDRPRVLDLWDAR